MEDNNTKLTRELIATIEKLIPKYQRYMMEYQHQIETDEKLLEQTKNEIHSFKHKFHEEVLAERSTEITDLDDFQQFALVIDVEAQSSQYQAILKKANDVIKTIKNNISRNKARYENCVASIEKNTKELVELRTQVPPLKSDYSHRP
jgi:chromosome segregation ATPase